MLDNTEIINLLLKLKTAFAENEGEILEITLNEKGVEALNAECQRFCSHCCIGICPACGRVTDSMVLGIKIKEVPSPAPTGVPGSS